MVKAGDIGKASKDFIKKDFFSSNEVKITQGCCASKNTTTFKLGDAVKADHKIEMSSVCSTTSFNKRIHLTGPAREFFGTKFTNVHISVRTSGRKVRERVIK